MIPRCVNLDWLECYVSEPLQTALDSFYFQSKGYLVQVREYGTPVFAEMFTLMDDHNEPFIEVRRAPKSSILPMNACHLRLHNYYCYHDHAAQLMADFITQHGYTFERITRADICLDFEYFDSGDNPQDFLFRYMECKYSKINQCNLSAHAADRWSHRDWNSLSWGSQTSDIGTKFYNKTLELYDPILDTYKKPYIRYNWQCCGLVDDWIHMTKTKPDGTIYKPNIWRIEFSIRSSVKRWFVIELDGHQRTNHGKQKHIQSVHNTLDMYDGRDKLLVLFASLAQHYFHFKHYKDGVRKDRCPDKILFRWRKQEQVYKVGKEQPIRPAKADKPLMTLLSKLKRFKIEHNENEIQRACDVLIRCIEGEQMRNDLNSPFRFEELTALRVALSRKVAGSTQDAAVLLREIREFLHLRDNVLPPIWMEK